MCMCLRESILCVGKTRESGGSHDDALAVQGRLLFLDGRLGKHSDTWHKILVKLRTSHERYSEQYVFGSTLVPLFA